MQVFCAQLPLYKPINTSPNHLANTTNSSNFISPCTHISFLSKTTRMKKVSITTLCLLVAAMAMAAVLTRARLAEAMSCNPMAMKACLPAIKSSEPPTAECCKRVKEQESCFCEYLKNPILKPYLNSPNAKKIAASCGVAFPTC